MTDDNKNNLANPESLLGMLQRGRGKGFLDALEAAPETVWPLLLECVTNDPRVDIMFEEREAYYASLIVATGMDLEPFRSHLVQNDVSDDAPDWATGLFLATLGTLAGEWQHVTARQILRDYVSYGRKWPRVMELLADVETPATLEQSVAALCRRVARDTGLLAQFRDEAREGWKWYCGGNEELRAECWFFLPVCEPWKTICAHNQELADLFAGAGIDYDQPMSPVEEPSAESLAGLSLEDLFSLVDESNRATFRQVLANKVSADDEEYLTKQLATGNPQRVILALRGLGKLGTPRAFAAVKAYLEGSDNVDRMVRLHAKWAIEEMPVSLTFDTVRQWFQRKEYHLQIASGGVLGTHATLKDIPLLVEALRTPETVRGEDCRLSSALVALTRFDGFGWIPELELVFCQVQSCLWRYRAAKAMAATAPVEFTSRYAFECLWDCHDATRVLGCKMVNLSTPGALERIREIAAEGNDNEDVRQAAAERLKGL